MARTASIHRYLIQGVGSRIALVREAFGETQAQLAAALGVDQATASSIEIERTVVPLATLAFLAERYCVSLQWLVRGTGEIFEPRAGVLYLGSLDDSRPCRAAIQLMLACPWPLSFCLIETHGMGPAYGWLIRTAPHAVVIILPGEEKPGFMVSAAGALVANGHQLRGRRLLTTRQFEKIIQGRLTTEEALAWLSHPLDPDNVSFPEVGDASTLPPAHRTALLKVLGELKEMGTRKPGNRLQAVLELIRKHPEWEEALQYFIETQLMRSNEIRQVPPQAQRLKQKPRTH